MDIARIVKYLMTGGIGITVNLGLYHVLVAYAHMHYLAGSIVAVSCSTVVGFLLQKFWTFEERTTDTAHTQFALYTILAVCNIGLNTLIVYALAGLMHVHYLAAQGFAAAVVAVWSYFLYREVVFKKREGSAL